jgi:TatD DNase family protein
MDSIAYPVGDSLYLNITNRCTSECTFCIRGKARLFNKKYELWLDKEPTAQEIIAAVGDPKRYEQIVFCGYGEPLLRLDIVKEVAEALKKKGARIRIDTNGHANLYWGRNILPELKGLINMLSISLNAENAEKYNRLCRPLLGEKAYAAVLEFIKEARQYIPEVEATIVDLPTVDKKACEKVARELGVKFRVRPYYEESYVR